MRVVFLALLLSFLPAAAFTQQYHPLKLFDLATGADVVTYGVITKVDSIYFYLYGFEYKKNKTFKIRRYAGRQGSFRWEKYAAGQEVFVFLKRNGGEYSILSPGAEGELPVIRDSLVIDMQCFMPKTVAGLAPKGITPEYRKMQTFDVGKKKIFGLRFTPKYLYQSIMAFRDCYQVILKKPNTFPSFTCFNFFDRNIREKTDAQKRKSKLMKLMYMDMEEAQMKNCN
jgi:hypothetical protein